MRAAYSALLVSLLLTLVSPLARSGVVTLDPWGSGTVQYTARTYILPPGFPPQPTSYRYRHDAPLEFFLQADYASTGCLCSELILTNGYAIYDLSAIAFTAVDASLQFTLDLDNIVEPNVIQAHAVEDFTPDFLLGLPTGGVGSLPEALGGELFDDLAEGTLFGAVDVSTGSGHYELQLTQTTLDLINAADGLLAIGLNHLPGQIYYDDIVFTQLPRLVMSERAAPVPAASTLWLLLASLLALGTCSRKRAKRIERPA